jgi:beta-glucanase (GH16 family)
MTPCLHLHVQIDIVEIWMGEGHFQHNRPGNPISMASSYHHGYGCSSDKYNYNIDTQWFPNMSDVSAPVIDFSADYHTFGVEWNDTALRFYVDGNTSFIRTLPTMCVTDPTWRAQGGWGKAPYMPWEPTYGIINVAVSQSTNIKWWQTHNATTYVDWVRWYQWVPSTAHTEVHASGQEEEGQAV